MRTKQIERQVYPRTDDMVKLQNERHAEGCSQGTWQERRMVDVKQYWMSKTKNIDKLLEISNMKEGNKNKGH